MKTRSLGFALLTLAMLTSNACAPRSASTWSAHGPTWQDSRTRTVDVLKDDLRPACTVALEVWNEDVGFRIFELVGAEPADILIGDAPVNSHASTFAAGSTVRVDVDTSDAALEPYYCAHELGHALGLRDDVDIDSIMHSSMPVGANLMGGEAGPDAETLMPRIHITHEDIAAVRRAYLRISLRERTLDERRQWHAVAQVLDRGHLVLTGQTDRPMRLQEVPIVADAGLWRVVENQVLARRAPEPAAMRHHGVRLKPRLYLVASMEGGREATRAQVDEVAQAWRRPEHPRL